MPEYRITFKAILKDKTNPFKPSERSVIITRARKPGVKQAEELVKEKNSAFFANTHEGYEIISIEEVDIYGNPIE